MRIAIVTGASSGMGKEFAKKIDELKLDEIWGIALGEEELTKTGNELKTPFKSFDLDLTNAENFKIIITTNKILQLWQVGNLRKNVLIFCT